MPRSAWSILKEALDERVPNAQAIQRITYIVGQIAKAIGDEGADVVTQLKTWSNENALRAIKTTVESARDKHQAAEILRKELENSRSSRTVRDPRGQRSSITDVMQLDVSRKFNDQVKSALRERRSVGRPVV
jgi:hypothetical protein